mmetsp:Transcript_31119/g.69153  ORF Transcript_31119/g.69153 Transcript_31119/m.69153 type:complete len:178 (+) Transcript_31119:83-616(+)|eukprot:CAMPEP_0202903096 /NCGR_PEP_ID=MMETSP1392-20130828/21387_1 /ASSEMBLY_ACC=CAM_ASM_000868 /TAXON_ID=225041 /ORGANISM="Chlamydomonas chlamydogama, Strain SAG 11-48b" /LENGTH=177 /DNA_ID=CAMNT_0049590075 /DNA_START=54 /DNA_END=587 /DNA_ORIENTATION=-
MAAKAELTKLPSRGILPAVDCIGWQRRVSPYVCTHDTEPPASQVVTTDNSTTALIRLLKKQQTATASRRTGDNKGKRPLDDKSGQDTAPAAKKPSTPAFLQQQLLQQAPRGQDDKPVAKPVQDTKIVFTQEALKLKSNKDLQELLRARGLPTKGNKAEMMQRLIEYQRRQKKASQPS